MGGHPADARHLREIDTGDPIEFAAQIERSGFVALPLVRRPFRPRRRFSLGSR